MWRFPVFDDVCKGWPDFLPVEGIPTQFCADSLFFEFGRAPNQGGARYPKQSRDPIIVQEERADDEQQAQSHDVGPPEQAKITFTTDDPDEAEADDEKGGNAEETTEEIHSTQLSVISNQFYRFIRGDRMTDRITFK